MDDFLLRAGAAGIGLALTAGPLGCFVVWRRLAYFGDTLAHAALLGVALALLLDVDRTLGIAAVCAAVAVALSGLGRTRGLAADTLLGIFSHTALALGLALVSMVESLRVDLTAYLFGDILAVTTGDLAWIYGGALAVLAVLALHWRPLLAATVDAELARVEGLAVGRADVMLTLTFALMVALALKIVGVLLMTALLVIPAAAARRWVRTPEAMAVLASLIGMVAVVAGLSASAQWDTPSGPSIVLAAALAFAVSLAVTARRRRGAAARNRGPDRP